MSKQIESVRSGLVAMRTLLSRDPCIHANTAIQMIDAMLAEQPARQEPVAIEYWLQDTMESGRWVTTDNMAKATAEKMLSGEYGDVYPQGRIVESSPPAQPRGEATLAREPLTDEQKKELFKEWADARGVWPRLTHEEIFYAGIEAAHGITKGTP